tara:strand:- start:1201 stop:1389 length:189 start_codon:yes stop_codon:yes gene_type:complete
MSIKGIKNGSLYFNEETQRLERVRSKANSQSVFTTVHNKELAVVPAKSLTIASGEQVAAYLR